MGVGGGGGADREQRGPLWVSIVSAVSISHVTMCLRPDPSTGASAAGVRLSPARYTVGKLRPKSPRLWRQHQALFPPGSSLDPVSGPEDPKLRAPLGARGDAAEMVQP